MKQDPKLNTELFDALINAAERRIGFTLCMEDFDFLKESIKEFANQAIDKFIDGAARHFIEDDPTFVKSVPHLVEIRKELVDAWFYALGEQKLKQQKGKQ